jgi:nucleotide-binding universal stress UspA family protein
MMAVFKKILVSTPANLINPSVILQSNRIAKKQHSHVTFFSVTEEIPKGQLVWGSKLSPQELMDNLHKEQQDSLNKIVENFQDDFTSIDTFNAVGLPFIEVTKKVQQDNYDLVILAAKTNSFRRKRFFGSTAVHLMRKCPCPVLAIDSNKSKPLKRIVAAIDAYAPTKEGHKLNESILHMASNVAQIENAELHVIHAWKLPDESYLKGWGATSDFERLELVMKKQQSIQKYIDKIIEKTIFNINPLIIKLLEGDVQEEIPRYVQENEIDLIVMGTVCRIGIPGNFIGNTAESILSEVSCSVLTLKPEGFISPVL